MRNRLAAVAMIWITSFVLMGVVIKRTRGPTFETSVQSTAPVVTIEGRGQWDTDDDRIVVGTGSGTAVFFPGDHGTFVSTQAELETCCSQTSDAILCVVEPGTSITATPTPITCVPTMADDVGAKLVIDCPGGATLTDTNANGSVLLDATDVGRQSTFVMRACSCVAGATAGTEKSCLAVENYDVSGSANQTLTVILDELTCRGYTSNDRSCFEAGSTNVDPITVNVFEPDWQAAEPFDFKTYTSTINILLVGGILTAQSSLDDDKRWIKAGRTTVLNMQILQTQLAAGVGFDVGEANLFFSEVQISEGIAGQIAPVDGFFRMEEGSITGTFQFAGGARSWDVARPLIFLRGSSGTDTFEADFTFLDPDCEFFQAVPAGVLIDVDPAAGAFRGADGDVINVFNVDLGIPQDCATVPDPPITANAIAAFDAGSVGVVKNSEHRWVINGTTVESRVNEVDVAVLGPSVSDPEMATDDFGDWSCDAGAEDCTLDSGVVNEDELAATITLAASDVFDAELAFLEIPHAEAPVTSGATGRIALDTTIADHQPLIQYFDGGEDMTAIAIDTAELPATDNEIVKYNAATDKFVLEEDAGRRNYYFQVRSDTDWKTASPANCFNAHNIATTLQSCTAGSSLPRVGYAYFSQLTINRITCFSSLSNGWTDDDQLCLNIWDRTDGSTGASVGTSACFTVGAAALWQNAAEQVASIDVSGLSWTTSTGPGAIALEIDDANSIDAAPTANNNALTLVCVLEE